MSDARWALIEPTSSAWRKARLDRRPTGQPAKVELRDMFNAILYVNRTGIPWKYVPHDFPALGTVYAYYAAWRDEGIFAQLNYDLTALARVKEGRKPEIADGPPSGATGSPARSGTQAPLPRTRRAVAFGWPRRAFLPRACSLARTAASPGIHPCCRSRPGRGRGAPSCTDIAGTPVNPQGIGGAIWARRVRWSWGLSGLPGYRVRMSSPLPAGRGRSRRLEEAPRDICPLRPAPSRP